jgi:enterochelin esterase-like enzyme
MDRNILKRLFILVLFIGLLTIANGQMPRLASGKLVRHTDFPTKYVTPRTVDVWLPNGYSRKKKYPVLYMQDGQMLFDSTITWNKKEWQLDETLGQLINEKKIRPCIVVAIWNTGTGRHPDYFPQKPFESLSKAVQDSLYNANRQSGASVFNGQRIHSDEYLKFLVYELKPFIDSAYSTLKNRDNTFISGSSMGGLISMYAICEYPNVFGGAACLSTHWPGIFTLENNPIPATFIQYLKLHLPDPKHHKIYFDHGDRTLDAWYAPYQQQADQVMNDKGFSQGKNWISRVFPGEDHSENAWAKRLEIPLTFLLHY